MAFTTLGYYNGEFGELDEMKIPMLDRAGYFGDGVYDATYSANHNIYMLDEHIDRFYNNAELVKIKIPHTKSELKAIIIDLVKKVECGEQFVYWQVTRGTAARDHAFPDTSGNIWIMLRPCKVRDTYHKAKLITLEDTRFLHCNIKTLNLLPSVIYAQKAAEAGCDESILHRGGRVTECAHSNVHIIKDGKLITAPADNLILPGIARSNIIKFAREFGITVEERPFTVEEMMAADEVIISSSGSFCVAACEIDGKPVGGRAADLIKSLQDALTEDFEKATALSAPVESSSISIPAITTPKAAATGV